MKFSIIMIFTCFIYHPQGLTEERKGKAVYEISAEKGMKLTKAALENIEVKTVKITEGFEASVPLSSLVQFQDQLGVYRVREDWFKLIKVEVIKKNYQSAQIHGDFLPGDSLVIEGASLLRISELDAFWSIEKL